MFPTLNPRGECSPSLRGLPERVAPSLTHHNHSHECLPELDLPKDDVSTKYPTTGHLLHVHDELPSRLTLLYCAVQERPSSSVASNYHLSGLFVFGSLLAIASWVLWTANQLLVLCVEIFTTATHTSSEKVIRPKPTVATRSVSLLQTNRYQRDTRNRSLSRSVSSVEYTQQPPHSVQIRST